jgi:hypothetical protein
MILHTYRFHQTYIVKLREIYIGMKNKKYLLMCGISQFNNLPVIGGMFFMINIQIYFSAHPSLEKP